MACHRSSHHQPCFCRCCCCCSSSSCLQCSPHSPSATTVDLLSQAIAFSLIQSPSAAVQPVHHHHAQEYAEPRHQCPCKEEHTQPRFDFLEKQHRRRRRRRRQQDSFYHYHHHQQFQPQPQSLIESLLGRIAALETTFPHLSTAPPSHSVRQQPPALKPRSPAPPYVPPLTTPRGSLRDLAARTIQTYFRRYLVRRSQALRHLRHLATIRSHVAAIKSSLSDEARLNPKVLYQGAANLFHQLDSIQSTDPMIREGKWSIGRELLQLLEFVDGISAKRHDLFMKSVGTATKGIDVDLVTKKSVQVVDELAGFRTVSCEDDEESDERGPKAIASLPKTTKKVSFAENGKGSKGSVTAGLAPLSDEELIGFPEVGGSLQNSDGEMSPKGWLNSGAMAARPLANGWPSGFHSPGLSAPLPVKMESRREGDSRRKKSVVVV